jgi:hypothetical protein
MKRAGSAGLGLLVLGVVATLLGCAGATGSSSAETPVPIRSVETVAGKWSGLLERGSSRREDLVELTIGKDGSYRFESARTTGALRGSGTLMLKDGHLSSASEHGSATYRLYDRGGRPILKVDAVGAQGTRYSAEFSR